uniref:General transcription factor 3C polypeptide 2 n=3 Tax=Cacopsylla melanoneura TaxID=428564 RepID=A0A8D8V4I2_9HEMI
MEIGGKTEVTSQQKPLEQLEDKIKCGNSDDTNNSSSNVETSTNTDTSKKCAPKRSNAKKYVQAKIEITSKKDKETPKEETMTNDGDKKDEKSSSKQSKEFFAKDTKKDDKSSDNHPMTTKERRLLDTTLIKETETPITEEDKMELDDETKKVEHLDSPVDTNNDETEDYVNNDQTSKPVENSKQISRPKRGGRTKRKIFVESDDYDSENDNDKIQSDDGSNSSSDIGGNSKKRKVQKGKSIRTSRKIVSESEESEKMDSLTDQIKVSNTKKRVSERPKRTRVQLDVGSNDSNSEDEFEEIAPKKTPVQTKKGRGRPPNKKVSVDVNDVTITEDDFEEMNAKTTPVETKRGRGRPGRKPMSVNKVSDVVVKDESMDEEDDPDDKELVTCQICSKEMNANVFEKKHKNLHHGICWTQNDTPIDYFNPQLVLDILALKRKQVMLETGRKYQLTLLFPCFFCSEVKRSELGYYSHLLVCNRSEEDIEKANIKCDRCEKTIFLPHYHAHKRTHWKEIEEEQEEIIHEIEESPGPSQIDGKRSAARRAVSKISNITQNLIDEEGDGQTRKRKKKEDAEFQMDDSEESDEDEEEEGEDETLLENEFQEDEEEERQEDSPKDDNFDMDLSGAADDDGCGDLFIPGAGGRKPLHQTYSAMRDLKSRHNMRESLHSSKPLYPDFKVPRIEFLPLESSENYLPRTKVSMLLQSPQRDSYQINLFSADVKQNQCTLFCGGPVWAMAWAPQPFSQVRSDEYLALAAQPDMNQSHEKNIPHSYKSLIQLWKFPQMSCLDPVDELQEPRIILGIAHEEGAVWDLQWCPSGGYIENERLGLLAAACSSGRVLVFAVPWHSSGADHIVLLEPVLTLQLDETNSTPCYHVAWKPNTPHELMYVGYGDGYVAVFNIQSYMNPMLQLKDKVILPINMFQAHQTEILTLSLTSCKNTCLLLTCGNDRMTKVWDVTDTSCPIQSMGTILQKKSLSGGFVPYLPLYATGSDYTHFSNDSGIGFSPVREFCPYKEGMNRFMSQNTAHFTMSFSAYTCSLLTGNENGNAYLLSFGVSLFSRMNKESPVDILHSKLIELNENSSDTTNENVRSTTYEHACQKYKLDFFSNPQEKEKVMNEEFDGLSVISSCWNNNANNFQFVALGQRCGFVHIRKNRSHTKVQLDKFLSYLDELNSSTK